MRTFFEAKMDNQNLEVDFSVGSHPLAEAESPEEAIDAADKAMYRTKRNHQSD